MRVAKKQHFLKIFAVWVRISFRVHYFVCVDKRVHKEYNALVSLRKGGNPRMKPKVERIKALMSDRNWSSSELARQMGVSRSETTRLLNGKRNGGNKVISGLIKAFPNEPLNSLFYLPSVYPNVNSKPSNVSDEKLQEQKGPIPVKHPNSHQLACTVNEDDGVVEIRQGKCVTTLVIPPGHVDIKYSVKTQ
jgi:transcriptional regulator with XRE-family HTH domain